MTPTVTDTPKAIDLFAGPGGWDVGARELGLDPLGIEFDDAACATREAAGYRTLQGDVSALDPSDFAPCDLLIASPPCQAWSMAGKRLGEKDKARVMALAGTWAVDPTAERGGDWEDERSPLAAEPMRWASVLRPRFMAWEQVPPVLELWSYCAGFLRAMGYSAWTGILSAEQYGVPQTRKRAILMASLDGPIHPPRPTHQRYVSGEPAREEHTLEGTLKPWVSMATALGWDGNVRTGNFTARDHRQQRGVPYERGSENPSPVVDGTVGKSWKRVDVPAPTVTAGGTDNGGAETFSRGGRQRISRVIDASEARE